MPERIHHVDLPLLDFASTLDFYTRVLGWKLKSVAGMSDHGWVETTGPLPEGVRPRVLTIEFDDKSYLAFVVGKKPDYSGDEPHVAVRMRHLKERRDLVQRLKDFKVEYEDNVGENLAFYDPNGLRIEIY
jgi:catechol 2,3-dioxygenase-like lactoylglutathione lyase family enzyme